MAIVRRLALGAAALACAAAFGMARAAEPVVRTVYLAEFAPLTLRRTA
jgi:hypothetical protein